MSPSPSNSASHWQFLSPQAQHDAGKSSLGKFASLRKGGRSLGKGVRSRFSRSLYSRSSSEEAPSTATPTATQPQQQQQQQSSKTAKALVPERKSRNKLCLLIWRLTSTTLESIPEWSPPPPCPPCISIVSTLGERRCTCPRRRVIQNAGFSPGELGRILECWKPLRQPETELAPFLLGEEEQCCNGLFFSSGVWLIFLVGR